MTRDKIPLHPKPAQPSAFSAPVFVDRHWTRLP